MTFPRARLAASQPAGRPLRLALLSDTHIPADVAERYRGFSPVENLAKVVPQVAAAPVDGALLGGDLARLKGLPEDYARLREMLDARQRRRCPWAWCWATTTIARTSSRRSRR